MKSSYLCSGLYVDHRFACPNFSGILEALCSFLQAENFSNCIEKPCWIVETDIPEEISARLDRKFRSDVACCLQNSTVSNSENNI